MAAAAASISCDASSSSSSSVDAPPELLPPRASRSLRRSSSYSHPSAWVLQSGHSSETPSQRSRHGQW